MGYLEDSYKCAICKVHKQRTDNNWLLVCIRVGDLIQVSDFAEWEANTGNNRIVCGEGCLSKLISKNLQYIRRAYLLNLAACSH